MPKFFLLDHLKPKKGFTMIELMISITILAIISSIGFVTYSNAQATARDGKRKQDLRAISSALELFYQANKRYPCTGSYVVNGLAGWQFSNTSEWLSDKYTALQNCTTTPGTKFGSTYINILPVDPVNNNTYSYQYFSYGGIWGQGTSTCQPHQYYLLMAPLENQNDKDRFANKPFGACGYTSSAIGVFANNTYLIIGGNQ